MKNLAEKKKISLLWGRFKLQYVITLKLYNIILVNFCFDYLQESFLFE